MRAASATLIFVRTETHIPANPETAEHTAPNMKENPIKIANLSPETGISPWWYGKFNGFYLAPYNVAIQTANTSAYLNIVPYCCLKNPSDPSNIVILTVFILLLPVFALNIQIRIYIAWRWYVERERDSCKAHQQCSQWVLDGKVFILWLLQEHIKCGC